MLQLCNIILEQASGLQLLTDYNYVIFLYKVLLRIKLALNMLYVGVNVMLFQEKI